MVMSETPPPPRGWWPSRQHRWTIWWMLFKYRQYVIEQIKKPLMRALIGVTNPPKGNRFLNHIRLLWYVWDIAKTVNRYPEPTKENTSEPNAHAFIDMWDTFLEHEDNPGRKALFKALRKMSIVEYEHDPYYRDRIDWFIEELVEAVKSGKWEPRQAGHPKRCWKEKYD